MLPRRGQVPGRQVTQEAVEEVQGVTVGIARRVWTETVSGNGSLLACPSGAIHRLGRGSRISFPPRLPGWRLLQRVRLGTNGRERDYRHPQGIFQADGCQRFSPRPFPFHTQTPRSSGPFSGGFQLSPRRRRHQSPLPRVLAALAILVVVLGLGWFWFQSRGEPEPTPPPVEETQPPVAEPGDTLPDVPPLDLPELSASDEFIRQMVSRLSEHPQLAAWLATDELVHRFVRVVVDLAGGSNPAANVSHMRPEADFSVRESEGRIYMAEASHERYDLLAATFASLDPEGTVRLYRQLRPLIDEAYAEMGIPDRSFHEMLEMAIENLLMVQPRDEPLELELVEGIYEYADPDLESLGGAEKALLRVGPENTRRIQEHLRVLRSEMEH